MAVVTSKPPLDLLTDYVGSPVAVDKLEQFWSIVRRGKSQDYQNLKNRVVELFKIYNDFVVQWKAMKYDESTLPYREQMRAHLTHARLILDSLRKEFFMMLDLEPLAGAPAVKQMPVIDAREQLKAIISDAEVYISKFSRFIDSLVELRSEQLLAAPARSDVIKFIDWYKNLLVRFIPVQRELRDGAKEARRLLKALYALLLEMKIKVRTVNVEIPDVPNPE